MPSCNTPPRDTPSRRERLRAHPKLAYALRYKERHLLPIRLKKLFGTVLLVGLVIVYAIVATIVAVSQLSGSGPLAHLAFFLFSGLLWVLPAMAIIKWTMVPRPHKPQDPLRR